MAGEAGGTGGASANGGSGTSNSGSSGANLEGQVSKGEASQAQGGSQEGTGGSAKSVVGKAAEKALKKYKVFGEEVEVDPSRHDEYIQKGLAYEKRSAKINDFEKKFIALNDALERGDRAAVKKLMGDERFRKFAVDEINDLIEQEEMTPQERAYRKREQELLDREKAIKDKEESEQKKFAKQLEDKYAKDFDEEFTKAVETVGLPKQPRVIGRMAQLMHQNIEMFEEPLPAEKIAALVKKELMGDVKSLLGALDGKQLGEILGEEVAKRVREHNIAQLKDPMSDNRIKDPVNAKVPENKEVRPFGKSMEDTRPTKDAWRDRLAKMKSQG